MTKGVNNMSIQQNQIIAIEKGVKNRAKTTLTEFYKTIQKPALFNGKIKKFEKINEDSPDIPDDNINVQMMSSKILKTVNDTMAEYFDVVATKDWGNCHAVADVVVDEKVIIEKAPVTYLLFLEKELADLRTFVSSFPTLDESHSWTEDLNSNLFRSTPTKTQRTAKIQKPIVLYDATDKHPAQTQLITEDVVVGYWNTTELSSSLPVPRKEQVLSKIESLLIAVKSAREEANSVKVDKKNVGKNILSFILD